MWVITSSCPVPIRLNNCQCCPSSFEENTCPSEVPRYSLLMSFGSCSSEITVPPGGPTCRQPCADAATLAANPSAITPNNLPFISMQFSQSADAPTSTSVGNRHFPVACPKGQIRGRLVIVLVRRSQHPF